MNLSGIQTAMAGLELAMIEKEISAEATFIVKSEAQFSVTLFGSIIDEPFDGKYSKHFYGETAEKVITDASAYIASIPDPETAKVRTFQRNLAGVIDEGHDLNMPDDVMDPLRAGSKALTENLLTHDKGAPA